MKKLFIGLAILVSSSLVGCSIIFAGNAEENLAIYSKAAGLTPIQCSNQDSDDDGYVSCDAKAADGQTVSLDCGYMPFAKGCKSVDRFKGRYNK